MIRLRRRPELPSSTHGSNIPSGMIRSGCGEEAVPDLPDNSFEWKRVTDPIDGTGEPSQAWTIRDWQHQGYQRILSRFESFSTHHAQDQPLVDVQNSDIIRVEEMFTYAPPISDGDRSTALQLPPVFYGGTRLAHLRPRLLSGFVRSVQFRALPDAADILVDVSKDEPIV